MPVVQGGDLEATPNGLNPIKDVQDKITKAGTVVQMVTGSGNITTAKE